MVDFFLKTRQEMIEALQISLRAVRQLLGLSAQELGELIGITRQTINNLELGKSQMSPTQYVALCAVIDNYVSEKPELLTAIKAVLNVSIGNTDGQIVSNVHNSSFLKKWFFCFPNDHNDFIENIEGSGENYTKFLSTLAQNYKIFVDWTFLVMPNANSALDGMLSELLAANNSIIVPLRVVEYLQQQILSSKPEEAHTAKTAIATINKYLKQGAVQIRGEREDSNVYSTFISVFAKYKSSYRLCLLTQDENLAKDIQAMNEKQEMVGFPIMTGFLSDDNTIKTYSENLKPSLLVEKSDIKVDVNTVQFDVEKVAKGWDTIE